MARDKVTRLSRKKILTASTYHLRQIARMAFYSPGEWRSLLRQELFYLLPRVSPAVAVDSNGVRYYVSTRDRGLGRTVFGHGSWEKEVMDFCLEIIEHYLGQARCLQGRIFIDVGANIGITTLPALVEFGAAEAIAFEPDAQNFRLLRCNAITNDVDERLHAFRVALSDETSMGLLERAEGNWGDHRIRVRSDLVDGSYGESLRPVVEVPMVRFDELVQELPIDLTRVGLVWMDTQGHEGHILRGASSLLATDIPVVTEYWPYGLARAGGLELLHRLVASHYQRVVDVRASLRKKYVIECPAAKLHELAECYGGDDDYTDLILLS